MVYEKVKYVMVNEDIGEKLTLIDDPINWNENDKTLKRSEKTYGVYTELSKNLKFTKQAATFLRQAYLFRDIEAKVKLYEYRSYPNKDGFYLHSAGQFDFSDYESEENTVSIPFKTGGITQIVESKYNEKFELERTESIDGADIGEFDSKIDIALTSRRILLISSYKLLNEGRSESFGASNPARCIVMDILSNSDEANIQPVVYEPLAGSAGGGSYVIYPSAAQYFYFNCDLPKTISLILKFNARISCLVGSRLDVYLLHTDSNDVVKSNTIILDTSFASGQFEYSVDWSQEVDLAQGDNLCLYYLASGDPAGSAIINYVEFTDFIFDVTEDSIRDNTTTVGVFMHEVGQRLMQILTGDNNSFLSYFYGRTDIGYNTDGDFARNALVLGFWIRQFYDKNFEISIKDFIESSNAIHNTGYTIETIEEKEFLVVEDMKYFFQPQIGIVINEQVSNINRKAAKDLAYSNLMIGYEEPSGDNLYEEAMGLDEYNTQTGYTLPITRVDDTFDKLSKFRADAYGKEFARRKQKLNFPKQDTRYDKDIWILDLIESAGTSYRERIWSDDYEALPKNVYSPETATNLRLSPFRNMYRHGWFFGGCLTKFTEDYVRYSNSIGNSDMSSQLIGDVERSERANIQIAELEKAIFVNQWIEFEYKVDYNLNQQIYGYTEIDGRKIPNYFLKVQFINEYGQKEYGYLFELQPNKEGKWKLLKAL